MDNSSTTGGSLLRLIGFMGLGVGVAWAIQIVGSSFGGSPLDRLMWILAAASVAGASFGLIVVAGTLPEEATVSINSDRVLS